MQNSQMREHVENKSGNHFGLFAECRECDRTAPIVRLICSCCTEQTTGRQWYNRDKGFGLCPSCAERIALRQTPAQMLQNYGHPNVNYFIKDEIK